MAKTRLRLVIVLLVAVAIACVVGRPTPDQIAAADCGPYPNDYEEIVKSYYSKALFDPYSAVWEFKEPPKKGWAAVPRGKGAVGEVLKGHEPVFGWEVSGRVNAKNRFGAYVGARPFSVIIRNGQVISASGPQ